MFSGLCKIFLHVRFSYMYDFLTCHLFVTCRFFGHVFFIVFFRADLNIKIKFFRLFYAFFRHAFCVPNTTLTKKCVQNRHAIRPIRIDFKGIRPDKHTIAPIPHESNLHLTYPYPKRIEKKIILSCCYPIDPINTAWTRMQNSL